MVTRALYDQCLVNYHPPVPTDTAKLIMIVTYLVMVMV